MKVSEAVASAVATEAGSAPIFSLIGDANLPIVGAIDRDTDATQWFARDEGAAVAMADGYSQSSDNLGIATVTSGPGLTHTAIPQSPPQHRVLFLDVRQEGQERQYREEPREVADLVVSRRAKPPEQVGAAGGGDVQI